MLTGEQREKIQDLFERDDVTTISRTISKHSFGGSSEQVYVHISTPDNNKLQSIINTIVSIKKDGYGGNGFETSAGDAIYIIPTEAEQPEVEQKEKTG